MHITVLVYWSLLAQLRRRSFGRYLWYGSNCSGFRGNNLRGCRASSRPNNIVLLTSIRHNVDTPPDLHPGHRQNHYVPCQSSSMQSSKTSTTGLTPDSRSRAVDSSSTRSLGTCLGQENISYQSCLRCFRFRCLASIWLRFPSGHDGGRRY